MERARANILRIGLFGIGLDTYWPQFAGLEERLRGYLALCVARTPSLAKTVDLTARSSKLLSQGSFGFDCSACRLFRFPVSP